MDWTYVNDKKPAPGMKVLVWYGPEDGDAYAISSVDEIGRWLGSEGRGNALPVCWMDLPMPPGSATGTDSAEEFACEIAEGRISLRFDEQKETVARLMLHFSDGSAIRINDQEYYVVDMNNEMVDNEIITTFYLRKADD